MAGFFKINRQIEKHWIWTSNEAFDKRSAWIDLIMKANYVDKIWSPNSKENIFIKRGSFPTSEVKLSAEWKWDRGKVRRFLKALENDNMIIKTATKSYIIITIVNYNNYQYDIKDDIKNATTNTTTDATTNTTTDATTESVGITNVEEVGTTTNTTTDAQRTLQQTDHTINNIININKDNNNIYIAQSEEIWSLYPKKKGKGTAIKKMPKLIKIFGYEQIKRCVERYLEEIKIKKTNIQYVKQGDTFFNTGYVDYLDENYSKMEGGNIYGSNKSIPDTTEGDKPANELIF